MLIKVLIIRSCDRSANGKRSGNENARRWNGNASNANASNGSVRTRNGRRRRRRS